MRKIKRAIPLTFSTLFFLISFGIFFLSDFGGLVRSAMAACGGTCIDSSLHQVSCPNCQDCINGTGCVNSDACTCSSCSATCNLSNGCGSYASGSCTLNKHCKCSGGSCVLDTSQAYCTGSFSCTYSSCPAGYTCSTCTIQCLPCGNNPKTCYIPQSGPTNTPGTPPTPTSGGPGPTPCVPSCSGSATASIETFCAETSYTVTATGINKCSHDLRFPTWSNAGGQDDIIWYVPSDLGGRTYRATINSVSHPGSGSIFTDVWLLGSPNIYCGGDQTTRFCPTPTPTTPACSCSWSPGNCNEPSCGGSSCSSSARCMIPACNIPGCQLPYCTLDASCIPTPPPCPQPPTGLTASCPSPGTSATVSWNASAGANYYSLRVDDQADLWDGSCSSPNGDFCLDLGETFYTFNTTPGHNYSWWVHSRRSGTDCWSNATYGPNFACQTVPTPTPTCPVPAAPAWIRPTGSFYPASTYNAVSWAAVAGATGYWLRVDDQSDGWVGPLDIYVDNYPGTSYSYTFTAGHTYSMWVHAGNACGNLSGATSGVAVVPTPTGIPPTPTNTPTGVPACPPPPGNLSSSCPAPGNSATVSWSAVPGADFYSLRVDDLTDTDDWDGSCSSPNGDFCLDLSGTSRTFVSQPGHSYLWWVHSRRSSDSCWSNATYGSNFTCQTVLIPTPTPTLVLGFCSPPDVVDPPDAWCQDGKVCFRWAWLPVPNANQYRVFVYDNLWTEVDDSGWRNESWFNWDGTRYYYDTCDLNSDENYFSHVGARGPCGLPAWSAYLNVSHSCAVSPTPTPTPTSTPTCAPPAPPQCGSPNGVILDVEDVTLSWGNSSNWRDLCDPLRLNNRRYRVYNSTSYPDPTDPSNLIGEFPYGTQSTTLTDQPEGDYFWGVTASNRDFTSTLGYVCSYSIAYTKVPWWQTQDGDVHVNGSITSIIPASCATFDYLSLAGAGGSPGVVSWGGTDTPDLGTTGGEISVRGWQANTAYYGADMKFDYLVNRLNVDTTRVLPGSGNTRDIPTVSGTYYANIASLTLNGRAISSGQKVVIFVTGDVTIERDITVAPGGFFALIVKGSLTFSGTPPDVVRRAQGFFLADMTINIPTSGNPDRDFEGQGSFVGWEGVSLTRDLGPGNQNCNPAELFISRPDMYLNAPSEFQSAPFVFQEVAP